METSDPQPPSGASTIPSPLQSVGLVAAALLVLVLGHALLQTLGAAFFFAPEQHAELTDPELSPFLHEPAWIVAEVVVPQLVLGAALLALMVRRRMPFDRILPLQPPGLISLVGALLLVFGLVPLADVVYWAASSAIDSDPVVQGPVLLERSLAGGGPLRLITVVVGFAVIPALVEESLFRGLVTAAHQHSFWAALLAPSALFGLFHIEPALAIAMAVLGLAFGLARLFSGSLFTAMFAHAAHNAVVIVTVHLNRQSSSEVPSATAVIAGLLIAAVGIVLLPMARVSPPPRPSTRTETPDA